MKYIIKLANLQINKSAILRRTLGLKNLRSTVDRRLSTVAPKVQVSDTTGDANRTVAG